MSWSLREWARGWALARAARTTARLGGGHPIALDYPPAAEDRPRWGHGREPHARLRELIAANDDAYRVRLERIAARREELAAIPLRGDASQEPAWLNEYLLGLDCASLYSFIRELRPARYVEVGSGSSTRWAARARRDGGLSTRFTAIDPAPRASIEGLVEEIVAQPLERADLGVFDGLGAGDVVFLDGSHRAFMNSDAVTFFLDVLPALAPGVLVGVHDVFLPADYPPQWARRYYSEQYLLACWLLAEGPRLEIVLPCEHCARDPLCSAVLEPLWADSRLAGVDRRGFTFWLRTRAAK